MHVGTVWLSILEQPEIHQRPARNLLGAYCGRFPDFFLQIIQISGISSPKLTLQLNDRVDLAFLWLPVGSWRISGWSLAAQSLTDHMVCMLRIWNKNPKNALISVYKWNSITLKLLYWFPIEFWNKIWLTNYSSSGFVIEMRDLFALLMIMQRLVSWIIRVIMVIRLRITNSMRQDNNYIIMWLHSLKIKYSD